MARGKLEDDIAKWNSVIHPNYRESLLRFFRRKMNSEADAEDMVQDVMARLVNRPPAVDARRKDAYIFTVAVNLLRDHARKMRVRAGTRQLHGPHDDIDYFAAASEAPDPERVLIGRSELERVDDALNDLPERTRSIFILCRMEGMTHREVAGQLGISVSAVEKQVAKALKHIADRLNS